MPFDKTLRERLDRATAIAPDALDARYVATYELFLQYFRDNISVPHLSIGDAKIGVVLVYSWMQPGALDPACWEHFALAKEALAREKDMRLDAGSINALRSFVGDSLIATSKFLHFFNPNRYAMWDTHVARAAYRYSWPQCNRPDLYLQYLDDLDELTLDDRLRERVQRAIGVASELRMKEFALFQLGIFESGSRRRDHEVDVTELPVSSDNFTIDLSTYSDNRD